MAVTDRTIHHVTVLGHPLRPQSGPLADAIAKVLRARGVDVWVTANWSEDDAEISARCGTADAVIAIGGDGAMLRAGRVTSRCAVPVLGVNLGRLGFLAEVPPDEIERALDLLLTGQYWIERRMMVDVDVWRGDERIDSGDALNDVVIGRNAPLGLVQLDAYIDGDWTTTYNCDALIIATATGSTAYALASGGPILPPELRNILLVPVAPHLTLDRPIVLPEGARVDIVVAEENVHSVVQAIDGASLTDLKVGDRVHVQASEHGASFIRLRERSYFYRSLLDRLEPRVISAPRQRS
ncbi:MAG: NAD(+)/NADH kinase [Anaerolineae bacterium]